MASDRKRRLSGNGQDRSRASKGIRPTVPAVSQVPSRPDRSPTRSQQAIPDSVANRMARRIAVATGIPTVCGMGVFVASYLLVSRHILEIPPSATLLASGSCFLLGLLGLSYGVLSASWEEEAGTLFGAEQIPLNLGRVRTSLRALREGSRLGDPGSS